VSVPIRRTLGRSLPARTIPFLLVLAVLAAQIPAGAAIRAAEVAPPDHLLISEIATGGTSASDEIIELYNPTGGPLPLEGLEVVYVSASGTTPSRRAAWDLGAAEVPAGGHVLVANEAGVYAPIADATYASGMAATGGSVAIRILGAATAIDVVGWGTASSWVEGTPSVAPAAGVSLERLPGGVAGSWQDTGDNAADFVERELPAPQNLASVPTPATEPAVPTPEPTAQPPDQTPPVPPEPTPVDVAPGPAPTPIAGARDLPDGATVTIEGVALTGSTFHDGGGYVADASGGIAVLVTGGTFARGGRLRVTGELDDRFSQRTLRADAASIEVLGSGADPEPAPIQTGAVGEASEGMLVRVGATIAGSASSLTTGVAFDLDDGSGVTRLVIGSATGIATTGWKAGTRLDLVGVVGQRDSTGAGSTGYRVMPRDLNDVRDVAGPVASPAASPSAASSPADPDASPALLSIAAARAKPARTQLVVRGVVTLPPGVVDPETAVIQDGTGAIVLRLGGDVGSLRLGQQIEASGTRSTMSGMETIRVTEPVQDLGSGSLPAPAALRSGQAGEEQEARLVVVRGAIVASARRAASGSASFDVDDGSGPLKVAIGAGLAPDTTQLRAGTRIEVRAVLGQQTTGSEPRAGYRLWPATLAAVRILAAPSAGDDAPGAEQGGAVGGTAAPNADLGDLDQPDLGDLRVGATLVAGPWKELGLGGLLWDGSSLVAVDAASADLVAAAIGSRRPPMPVELGGLNSRGMHALSGLPLVAISAAAGDLVIGNGLVAAPRTKLTPAPAWVSVIGRLGRLGGASVIHVRGQSVRLELRCDGGTLPPRGSASVTGVALGAPMRLVLPCGGLRPVPVLRSGSMSVTPGGRQRGADAAISARGRTVEHPLAGALLLAAGSTLAAIAIWRRVRAAAADPGATGEAADATMQPSDAEPDDQARRLTLVGVPREHGP
jgi:hypothetical protein